MKFKLFVFGLLLIVLGIVFYFVNIFPIFTYTLTGWQKTVQNVTPFFLKTKKAEQIALSIMQFQSDIGGWPKNIIYHHDPVILKGDNKVISIDNGATTTELTYLANMYQVHKNVEYKNAIIDGINYLLSAQYENGGWPQSYPDDFRYRVFVTFNDDAMTNVMFLLKKVLNNIPPFNDIVDEELRRNVEISYYKGIECILKTQLTVNGRKTIWAQQYNQKTLMPEGGRNFELPALAPQESTLIILLLMDEYDLKKDPKILEAVDDAVNWLKQNQLSKVRIIKFYNRFKYRSDMYIIHDRFAPPIWARFYDLETSIPFFSDRKGRKYYDIKELPYPLKFNYNWYTNSPLSVLKKYKRWRVNII